MDPSKAIHGIQMELSVQSFSMSDMRHNSLSTQHSRRVSDGISVRSGPDAVILESELFVKPLKGVRATARLAEQWQHDPAKKGGQRCHL